MFGGGQAELLGWFVRNQIADAVEALSTENFTNWIMERNVRRPSGRKALDFYHDPLCHRPNFPAILYEIGFVPGDRVLEVGYGAGAFIKEGLKSGCTAACLDHRPEQVMEAASSNERSMHIGKLALMDGEASKLPFADVTFTCAVMQGSSLFCRTPSLRFLNRGDALPRA